MERGSVGAELQHCWKLVIGPTLGIVMQLSLEVRGKRNLEESLDFYVSGELMEGDNQYYCEEIGRKVKPGFQQSSCSSPALQLQLLSVTCLSPGSWYQL